MLSPRGSRRRSLDFSRALLGIVRLLSGTTYDDITLRPEGLLSRPAEVSIVPELRQRGMSKRLTSPCSVGVCVDDRFFNRSLFH